MNAQPVDVLERLQEAPGAEVVLGAVADEPDVWVVGGAVRDALLGRIPRELDLVVEGDAIAVARRAAARAGGRVVAHERFGTATVDADGVVFDVAGARGERYERPGALPTVRLGASLEEDLARRDFTVNAMAVRLADGRRAAVAGADEDVAAHRLRVLHDRSFADDPTRVLRMARYAARLGFAPDPDTQALAERATLDTVSPERVGRELRLLLGEPQPAALAALARWAPGLGLSVDEAVVADAARLGGPLAALAAAWPGVRYETLIALGFPAREAKVVAQAVAAGARGGDGAGEREPDSSLWRRFHRAPPEAVAVAAARGDAGAARWLAELRDRRLSITGDDLVAAGLRGPAVGAGLAAAMEAFLDGRAPDRGAQLAAALDPG